MQNRYVGDRHDFIKYLVLRRVRAAGKNPVLGVNWYLTDPDVVDAGRTQDDGKNVAYLLKNEGWRKQADPELYSVLRELLVNNNKVDQDRRNISAIPRSGILGQNAIFFDESVPYVNSMPHAGSMLQAMKERGLWHKRALNALSTAEVTFLDPDNSAWAMSCDPVRGGKWAARDEVLDFEPEKRMVIVIGHPPHEARGSHHERVMAYLSHEGEFSASAYFGSCCFHILAPRRDEKVEAIYDLVQEGVSGRWGTWRYRDSDGRAINMDELSTQPSPPEERKDDDGVIQGWSFQFRIVVNDSGCLWKKQNPWLDTHSCWEVSIPLENDEREVIRTRFEPFGNQNHLTGVKPIDRENWQRLSSGASLINERVYRGFVRPISRP